MKPEAVKVYTTLVFEGVLILPDGNEAHDVFTFSSLTPISIERTDVGDEEIKEAKGVFAKMLKGAGIKYAFKLESATPIYSTSRDGKDTDVTCFKKGVIMLSPHDEVMQTILHMPVEMVRGLFKHTGPLMGEPFSMAGLLDEALKFDAERGVYLDKYGIERPNDPVYNKATSEAAALRKFAERMDAADESGTDVKLSPEDMAELAAIKASANTEEGVKAEVSVMQDIKFIKADATDFRDAGIACGDHYHDVGLLRMVHTEQPTWHEPTDDMKAHGYIGYWHFNKAAVAMNGKPKGVELPEGMVEGVVYGTRDDVKLCVHSQDAINPAGSIAVPEALYREITKDAAPKEGDLMDCDAATKYTETHLLPWPQAVASAIAEHAVQNAPTKPIKQRKSN